MNAQKYITNVEGLEHYDAAVIKAAKHVGKLARVQAGWYLVVVNGELVEIMQRSESETGCNGWWDFREVNRKWHGDTLPTLSDVKWALEIK